MSYQYANSSVALNLYLYFMNKISKFLIVLAFCNFIFIYSFGQKAIKNYVQENTHVIKSIDASYSDDKDLEPIGNAIGDARLVMLGEQDHGDAPTYLAKTRLIKYLHEKKGFNVLAFESDFYALNKGWRQLSKAKEQISNFLRKNVYPLWTECDACSNLFYTYIPETFGSSDPLQITGFDDELGLNFTLNNLTTDLDSLLQTPEIKMDSNDPKRQMVISSVDSFLKQKRVGKDIGMDQKNLLQVNLKEIDSLLSAKLGPHDFWVMVIENLISYVNLTYENRDSQMAANLQWLLEYAYPGQKIIVWAANPHIMKYTDLMNRELGSKNARKAPNLIFRNMGTDLTNNDTWKRETYVLGFTSARGRAGRLGNRTFQIPDPWKGSFESWIDTSYRYGFVNFIPFNKKNPDDHSIFQLKGFYHMYYPKKFDWNRAFDGIFYIRDMYPCKENSR